VAEKSVESIGVQGQDVASQDFSLALEMTFQAARVIGRTQEYSKDVQSNEVFQNICANTPGNTPSAWYNRPQELLCGAERIRQPQNRQNEPLTFRFPSAIIIFTGKRIPGK